MIHHLPTIRSNQDGYDRLAELAKATAKLTADRLELDLSRVDEIDSAGLQLLLLLRREAQAQGKPFGVGARSAAVDDLLSFCNLNDELDAGASR